MPLSALTGNRLRERRLANGIRQADLAAMVGISASYLNLIEHDRRKVHGALLARLADALGFDRTALAQGS
ncbi:MAG: XRE family transcriptional regulator, partial [Rhodobacterales bacterium]